MAYKEEVWVSHPQQVVVVRLSSSKANALNFDFRLHRKERATFTSAGNAVTMQGQLNGDEGDTGIKFAAYGKALMPDRKVTAKGDGLKVEGGTDCLLILGAATDLNWPQVEKRGPAPLPVAQKQVDAATKMAWPVLLKNYIADYQSLFNRSQLHFTSAASNSLDNITTPQRMMRYAAGKSDV